MASRNCNQRRLHFLLVSYGLLATFVGCASTDLPPLDNYSTRLSLEKDERVLWEEADKLVKLIHEKTESFPEKSSLERYLNRVLKRVSPDFHPAELPPRSYVILHPHTSAFTFPNGAIFITTGMLALLENEAQLAMLLAHELQHFRYRHSIRDVRVRQNSEKAGLVVGILLAGLAGSVTGIVDSEIPNSNANAWSLTQGSRYSQQQELEADRLALEAMIRAGYAPQEAVRFLRILQTEADRENDETPEPFSSHPDFPTRISRYETQIKVAADRAITVGAETNRYQYERIIAPVLLKNARLDVEYHGWAAAEKNIRRYLSLHPDSAEAYFWLGEVRRNEFPRDHEKLHQAISFYERSLKLDSSFAASYREIGLIYRYLKQRDRSREFLTRYIELAPDEIDVPIIKSYLNP